MALIKRDTDYALRALTMLAQTGDSLSVRALAASQEVPPDFLRKIMQRLHRAHIVKSSRGPFGGYRLSRPAGEISVLDVVEAVQGPLVVNECAADPGICSRTELCPFRKRLLVIQDDLSAKLAGLRVSDAVEEMQALGGTPT